MQQDYTIYAIILCFLCMNVPLMSYKAVAIEPIINLIGKPIDAFYPTRAHTVSELYNAIPLCGGERHRWISCPRLHQVLYNEVVDIREEREHEVKVRISNLFYTTTLTTNPQMDYWAPRHAFAPLEELEKQNIDVHAIPDPINFSSRSMPQQDIVTLLLPYYSKKMGYTFSAGTRFVQVSHTKKDSKKKGAAVLLYDHRATKVRIMHIPRDLLFMPKSSMTFATQRDAFVSILQQWAHMKDGFIPYVWGGCSIVHAQTGPFEEKTAVQAGSERSYFVYQKNAPKPYTGIDCSGLISRAAQIVGIPYFYKNSYTLAQGMTALKRGQHIQKGDLIWMPGHVMIVSDRDRNLVIEARSYFSGYGKVHEVPLGTVFKDIFTLDSLEQAFFSKTPLKRLDIQGVVKNVFPEYKLLSLSSVWSD